MDRRIEDFFDWLIDRLFTGSLEWLEDVYVYPMSVFVGEHIHIEVTPIDTIRYIEMRRDLARNAGVNVMSAHVKRVRHKENAQRFSAKVEFVSHREDGTEIARELVNYRCHFAENGSVRIESVELMSTDPALQLRLESLRLH